MAGRFEIKEPSDQRSAPAGKATVRGEATLVEAITFHWRTPQGVQPVVLTVPRRLH